MKKALSVLLVLAMVGAIFAAEPVANLKVASFTGSATVKWGVDLDTKRTGFLNSETAALKLNFFGEALKSTEGSGVWGELVIKVAETNFESAIGTVAAINVPAATVEKAQININDFYIGIRAGGTQVGKFNLPTALANDNDGAWDISKLGAVGPNKTQGIVLGFKMPDLFGVDVDFRSKPNAVVAVDPDTNKVSYAYDTQYSDDYAMAVKVWTTPIKDLKINLGASFNLSNSTKDPLHTDENAWALGANVAYKMAINDTFYVQPAIGYTYNDLNSKLKANQVTAPFAVGFITSPIDAADLASINKVSYLGASVLFGWTGGADKAGLYYLDESTVWGYATKEKAFGTKKAVGGVSFDIKVPLVDFVYNPKGTGTEDDGNFKDSAKIDPKLYNVEIPYSIQLYSGKLVDNLTFGAIFSSHFNSTPKTYYIKEMDGGEIKEIAEYKEKDGIFDENGKSVMQEVKSTLILGAAYNLKVADLTITPKAGTKMDFTSKPNQYANDEGKLVDDVQGNMPFAYVSAGVDVAGLIKNTTFGAEYVSRNLRHVAEKNPNKALDPLAGTFNVYAKISF